jgi:hypothetical protein
MQEKFCVQTWYAHRCDFSYDFSYLIRALKRVRTATS